MGQLYYNSLFLGDLFEYLDLEPEVVSPERPRPLPAPPQQALHFENVSFSYPGSARPALESLDLQIPSGRVVAIVGPNGSGKTTLVKLLLRFYDPTAGSINLDGVDLREFSLDELRRSITVLFQQPVQYNATVRENIAWGDVSFTPAEAHIRQAAEEAGLDSIVARLPGRYDQVLGKWFRGGTDLSVGEWQRIALARAFLRRAPLIVLDEPTSAMDPWAESKWLSRFRKLAVGRTALVITHRFTTALCADVIHVMEHGRIVESGSHGQLIQAAGRYAAGWKAQMREAPIIPDTHDS
jgi:ATP-binding cassette subfamily B protein